MLYEVTTGQITMAAVVKVIDIASQNVDVVGIGIAEHLPWDSLNLKKMLEKLPLIGKK